MVLGAGLFTGASLFACKIIPAMPYTHTTLTAAEDQLAARLADSAKIRFISDELQTYIIEALRTWSSLTGMWEISTDAITVAAGTQFIDIPTEAPDYRDYTLKDQDLIGIMQYHLMEPKSVSSWTGTAMFVLADLTKAIQRRRDQFLLETSCRVVRSSPLPADPGVIAADAGRYSLPESVIAVKRVAWRSVATGVVTPLWPSSLWSKRASRNAILAETGTPETYLLSERAPLEIEFNPVNSATGTIDLVAVEAGATLDPSTGVLLGIPDDFAWVVKWGALADLFAKDGPARDYARALFCERRWRMGIAAALSYSPLVHATINGLPAQFTTIEGLDAGRRSWQSLSGTPQVLAPIGMNLLAIADPPSASCSLILDLCRNAPIPAAAENIQIGKEYLDLILGYAVHLAMFKVAGTEFAATIHLANAFFEAAMDYNEKLRDNEAFEAARIGGENEKVVARGVRRVTGATVAGGAGSAGAGGSGGGAIQ